MMERDPISRPGLLTSFHLVFAGPSLGQHSFEILTLPSLVQHSQIVFVYLQLPD